MTSAKKKGARVRVRRTTARTRGTLLSPPVDRRESSSIRDFSLSLPMALLQAREAVMQHFRASLRHHNLTEQQWRVLRAVNAVDEIKVTDLARRTFLRGPSLTRILRDLDARRLIERRASNTDLRSGLISISPNGEKIIDVVGPESEAIYAEIARRIGDPELIRLQELLKRLEQELSSEIKV
jgi:homoprotocatechuate degradation regulator HpaR